ncbi:ABC transporter ATP-binding protein [Pollutimonas sp. M17]|uniref:ABC transporter ATP-binding protein n=1 Tax=Pollutimonas sp. M17 TaxID=2962065 RepID=UPI0021F48AE1|nr:ABC transporter ATP-binding protein [Pollutimonas sp. M17]UYO94750.1 ABC transporter ATP-binding protein [Pollutimonas sp. M17]
MSSGNKPKHPILQVTDLSARYGKVNAVVGANISVTRGSIVTVIGGNGAGKSTLLNSIMGSLPATGNCSGSVQYLGSEIGSWQVERRVSDGISLVPERRELFGSMSVEDNLLLGGFRLYRAGKHGWKETINEVYDLFPRLRERKAQQAGTLSGGERQMLAVGRALMAQPQLLMLDEPSLGLAPRIVREIFQIIARLRSTGVAILLVEQNARAALQVADYGYVLETGEVVLEGKAKELSGNPRVIESYLGLGNAKKEAAGA